MTTAVFTLFVASGLCLTFSAITAIYAIRTLIKAIHAIGTLENAIKFLYFAWNWLHGAEQEEYKKEDTE